MLRAAQRPAGRADVCTARVQEWTPQANWLGGVVRGGDAVYSAPAFIEKMSTLGMELVEQSDVPFLIREHGASTLAACDALAQHLTLFCVISARKFQWGCSHATVWRRKA